MVFTLDVGQSKLSRTERPAPSLELPADLDPLYELALTHRSYAFENESDEHNERLEFLGDAIVGAVVTDLIYNSYPDLTEGEMARLRASVVNTHALADIAAELGLDARMRLGKGEEASGGRTKASLLANAFEAVVGALYLDQGLAEVARRLTPIFVPPIEASMTSRARYDAKTALQEVAVRQTGDLPDYRVASSGPDHDKRFVAHVFVDGREFGSGTGRSKKEAEQQAATEALERFEESAIAEREGRGDARAS